MRQWLVILLAATVSACSPKQGYPGPERPEGETALVVPEITNVNTLLRGATADGIEFDSNGITLLPGKHAFLLTIQKKGDRLDCEKYSTLDTSGFDSCLADTKRSSPCDCYDYVSIIERCFHRVREVFCRDQVTLSAGKKLTLVGVGDFTKPGAELRDSTTRQTVKALKCTTDKAGEEPFTNEIGTGRFTAQQYGVATQCD